MKNGFFDIRNYYQTVERNILINGHVDYKVAGISEESLDKIIHVYKKRIFEYPGKRRI
jgi:hypothetical protein